MTRRRLLVPDELPEWFVNAAPNASFRIKDVADIFGYSSHLSLRQSSHKGYFPKPEKSRGHSRVVDVWTKAAIQQEFERRQAENARIEAEARSEHA